MQKRKFLGSPALWTAVWLILVSGMVYFRSVHHVCVGDELRYFYQFHLSPGENYFNFSNLRLVESMGDVWDSQVNHYLTVNGRSLVHGIEQIFAGVIPMRVFYVLNVFVFALALLLLARAGCGDRKWRHPAWMVASVVIFLYLFPVPARLCTSVNLSLNYLWPSCALLGVYCIWRRMKDGWRPSWPVLSLIVLLSFFLGWSNEAFSFPFSAALGIYYIMNIRQFRGRVLAVTIPLWTGAVIMACSPGNWLRAGDSTALVASYFDILLQLKMLWLTLAAIAVAAIVRRRSLTELLRSDYTFPVALLFALAMGVLAHTAVRAFTAIELFSAIILLSLASRILPAPGRKSLVAAAALGTVILIHQAAVSAEHYRQYISIREAVRAYRESPTGTVRYDYRPPHTLLAPFVYSQIPASEGADYEWRLLGISKCGSKKPFTALAPEVFDSLDVMTGNTFHAIGRSRVGIHLKGSPRRYDVVLDNGTEVSLPRRLFSHNGRTFRMIIPPEGRTIDSIVYPNSREMPRDGWNTPATSSHGVSR